MEINDALKLIQRLENLPEIYDQIERAVCGVMQSYYTEMLEVEIAEAAVMANESYEHDELTPFLESKRLIHEKYWSNLSGFYRPCSSSSEPEHVWNNLLDIEVIQNGDENNSLFIFKANYRDPDINVTTVRAYLLKLKDESLKIEHLFFG
jgi:hypothetical protein